LFESGRGRVVPIVTQEYFIDIVAVTKNTIYFNKYSNGGVPILRNCALQSLKLKRIQGRSMDGQKTWPCAEAIRAKLILLSPENAISTARHSAGQHPQF
jgi:hypothetical protein